MKTFAASRVGLDSNRRISAVLWGREDKGENAWATPEVVSPVAAAVHALHAGETSMSRWQWGWRKA